MSQRRTIFLFFVVVAGLAAVFFYLNRSKTVGLKEVINSPEFINEIINNDAEKKKAEDVMNGLRPVVNEFEELRVPEESYTDEYYAIEQLFNSGDYSRVIVQSTGLEEVIRAAIDVENKKPKISITFDAGAGSGATQKLIDYLADSRLKITFFSTGKWTEQNPELFKKVLVPKEGLMNELGNHTYSHPHLVSDALTDDQIREEINKTENIFGSFGYSAKPLFRYPYGERSAHTDNLIKELGYSSVYWTVDSLGWQNKQTSEQIAERVIGKIKPKGITLMHVGSNEDVASVPLIVEKLRSQYRFVFVSEL